MKSLQVPSLDGERDNEAVGSDPVSGRAVGSASIVMTSEIRDQVAEASFNRQLKRIAGKGPLKFTTKYTKGIHSSDIAEVFRVLMRRPSVQGDAALAASVDAFMVQLYSGRASHKSFPALEQGAAVRELMKQFLIRDPKLT